MTTSRYRVLPRPVRVPGTCKFCGSSKGPVIDTLVEIDFEGSLYICIKCAKEIGRTAGLVDPVLEKEEVTNVTGPEVNERFKNGLLDFVASSFDNFIGDSDFLLYLPEDKEAGSGDSAEPTGSAKKGARTSRSKRSDDVSDDTSDGAAADASGTESDIFRL